MMHQQLAHLGTSTRWQGREPLTCCHLALGRERNKGRTVRMKEPGWGVRAPRATPGKRCVFLAPSSPLCQVMLPPVLLTSSRKPSLIISGTGQHLLPASSKPSGALSCQPLAVGSPCPGSPPHHREASAQSPLQPLLGPALLQGLRERLAGGGWGGRQSTQSPQGTQCTPELYPTILPLFTVSRGPPDEGRSSLLHRIPGSPMGVGKDGRETWQSHVIWRKEEG